MFPTIAYDARPLQPETRHWGPGVCVESLLQRLSSRYDFIGVPARLPAVRDRNITRLKRAVLFDVSPWFAPAFDVYWGTNDYLPQLLRKPSVVTVHDLLPLNYMDSGGGLRAEFLKRRFVSSVHRARMLITDSKTTAGDLVSRFPELGRRVEVGLLGFDAPVIHDGADGGKHDQETPYVLMLGSHKPRKNLPLALAAVDRTNAGGLKVPLWITGNIDPVFEPLVRTNSSLVRPLGVLPKKEIFTLLRNSVALLFTSLYEGFGFPLLEAMAAGCPVLALDTPINREIGGNAVWLLKDDAGDWASAIKTLMESRESATELREKGFENLKRFSWDRTAKIYGELFTKVAQ